MVLTETWKYYTKKCSSRRRGFGCFSGVCQEETAFLFFK
ncbi:hypothetical protein B4114_2560 [Geobacillus stearothermophilus]|uniref:Uncharacterized protein n=1 Tax=Geobacillus stearothermophilus TaxID=1422 RepID=A0A150NBR2_GEOSE|nr:hypothetical protein B4114_2560 [Geobacillus stearothermophilus]